jgi:hypothetical protein
VKPIANGTSDVPLTDEEQGAIEKALGARQPAMAGERRGRRE